MVDCESGVLVMFTEKYGVFYQHFENVNTILPCSLLAFITKGCDPGTKVVWEPYCE